MNDKSCEKYYWNNFDIHYICLNYLATEYFVTTHTME